MYCNFRQATESQPVCEETTLYCRECDITFSKACTLKRHLQSAAVHLKKDAPPVKCPNCFKPFPCNRAMREHLIRCTRKLRKQQDEIPAKRKKLPQAAAAREQGMCFISNI